MTPLIEPTRCRRALGLPAEAVDEIVRFLRGQEVVASAAEPLDLPIEDQDDNDFNDASISLVAWKAKG